MIDWKSMSEDEYLATMVAGRADGDRRIALHNDETRKRIEAIEVAMGTKKGPGRPRNGSTQTLTAADLDPADTDS
jgi:hypothetical protein